MKKQSFLLTSALALTCFAMTSITSCTKLAKNLQYNLDMQTATVDIVIPPYSDTTANVMGTQTNYYNIDSFIKANTANVLGVSNITSAKLSSCVLTIVPTSTTALNNFGNFKTVSASFHTNGNTTPYTLTITNNPSTYSETLSLPVDTTAELKGYLSGGNQFTYNLSGTLRRAITDSIHCKATITFKVRVQG
jgi:hypothetical protein